MTGKKKAMKNFLYNILIFTAAASLLIFIKAQLKPESEKGVIQGVIQDSALPDASYGPESCDNYGQIGSFSGPVNVVWMAKVDECFVSCYGAAFTRVPEDKDYPRFAGYYSDVIPSEFVNGSPALRIYGEVSGIYPDHSRSVFSNKCVPVVNISKIEKI